MDCNESVVIMSAVRYGLGRNSYGVGCICDYILARRKDLSNSNKEVICRDIKEYFEEHLDAPQKEVWFGLKRYLEENL